MLESKKNVLTLRCAQHTKKGKIKIINWENFSIGIIITSDNYNKVCLQMIKSRRNRKTEVFVERGANVTTKPCFLTN